MQAGKVGKESELDSIAPKSVLKYLSCVESDLKKITPIIMIDSSPRQKNFKHKLQLRLTDHVIHDHNRFNKKFFGLLGLHN